MRYVALGMSLCWALALARAQSVQSGATANPTPIRRGDPKLAEYLHVNKVTIANQITGNTVNLDVEVQVTSTKIITAYGLFLHVRYPHGETKTTQVVIDALTSAVAPVEGGPPALQQGVVGHAKGFVSLDSDSLPPTAIDAEPSSVVFIDRTALGVASQIGLTARLRSELAQTLADILADIQSVQTDVRVREGFASGTKEGLTMLREALLKVRNSPPQNSTTDVQRRASDLFRIAQSLRAGKARFESELAEETALQKVTAEHAHLLRGEL